MQRRSTCAGGSSTTKRVVQRAIVDRAPAQRQRRERQGSTGRSFVPLSCKACDIGSWHPGARAAKRCERRVSEARGRLRGRRKSGRGIRASRPAGDWRNFCFGSWLSVSLAIVLLTTSLLPVRGRRNFGFIMGLIGELIGAFGCPRPKIWKSIQRHSGVIVLWQGASNSRVRVRAGAVKGGTTAASNRIFERNL